MHKLFGLCSPRWAYQLGGPILKYGLVSILWVSFTFAACLNDGDRTEEITTTMKFLQSRECFDKLMKMLVLMSENGY